MKNFCVFGVSFSDDEELKYLEMERARWQEEWKMIQWADTAGLTAVFGCEFLHRTVLQQTQQNASVSIFARARRSTGRPTTTNGALDRALSFCVDFSSYRSGGGGNYSVGIAPELIILMLAGGVSFLIFFCVMVSQIWVYSANLVRSVCLLFG